jgi:hypothetical protein
MKFKKLFSAIFLGAILCLSYVYADEQPMFIYLVDPQDQDSVASLNNPTNDFPEVDVPLPPKKPAEAPAPETPTPPKPKLRTLDEIIDGVSKNAPYTKSQERILRRVSADQVEFVHLMDEFVKASFDSADDQAKPEFNRIRDRIVSLVFDAPNEKFYYERLFLINKSWLDHQTEQPRFSSLDKALRDKSLALEERTRRFRQIIMGVAAVGGAVAGGFLSYKAAEKILPVVANDKGFSTIVRWAGRGTIIFIGAGVGAAAGAYIGFLGSEYLFRRRDFIEPIDGSADLRDILQVIEALP